MLRLALAAHFLQRNVVSRYNSHGYEDVNVRFNRPVRKPKGSVIVHVDRCRKAS